MADRTRRTPRTLGVLFASLLCCLAVAPAAMAAPTWLTPVSLSTFDSNLSSVSAGADGQGGVVAAWVRFDGTNYIVEVAHRSPGGTFTTQTLQSGTSFKTQTSVAVNDAGAAVVAWRNNGATTEIWAATRGGRGDFGTAAPLASVPGKHAFDPSVAIGDGGHMAVLWRLVNSDTDGLETIYAAFRTSSQAFSAAPVSSTDTWNQSPRGVIGPDGKLTVVWSYWDGTTNIARVRVRAADGTLGTQRNLSAGAPTGYPMFATVDLDANGNAVAVWSHWNGTVYDVEGATRSAASDTWNTLPKFGESAGASFGNEPQVAVDRSGNAVAIWRAANNTIQAASRAAGAGFGAAQAGISAPTATNPKVQLDGSGNAIAIWQRSDSDGSRIESASRPLGGLFGAVRRISAEGGASQPALGVDPLGNAFAAWRQVDGTLPAGDQIGVRYAVYDADAPALSNVSVPSSGVAGTAMTLSASATDVWTTPVISWNFGDGSTGSGTSVNQTYAQAGSYTVTITATDEAGNTSSTTRTVQVAPKPNPVVDADGDGAASNVDCNDNNPAVKPGATDIPNNGVDEDCANGDAIARVTSGITHNWFATSRFTRVISLTVNDAPKNATIIVLCKGKGCKFKKKTVRSARGGKVNLTKLFNYKRKRRKIVSKLRVGTRVTVMVTAPGSIGKAVVFTMRKKKIPSFRVSCVKPGATTPSAC